MAAIDWNWRLPTDLQDVAWDCAACSTAWAMRTVGRDVSEADVIAGLGPERISPSYGLLDASGAGLVSYLAEQGIVAENDADATWQEVVDGAGYGPMVIGGRNWCHWVAVRMGGPAAGFPNADSILLMNPSPGYMGVYQALNETNFDYLGPFSAVWFNAW